MNMGSTRKAAKSDVEVICSFDSLAKENDERRKFVERAIAQGNCFVILLEGQVVGYGVLEHWFYGNGFISMLMVHPEHRKKGVGSAIINHLESVCTTERIFTSTNQSNIPMQSLLAKLGYRPSGKIENLDEGDPELVYFKSLSCQGERHGG